LDHSSFTDDSVLSIALADAVLHDLSYKKLLKEYYFRYPGCGYGAMFHNWASSTESLPYNSWGNGAAMRISPVGWAFGSVEETLVQAERFTSITHNHPEGIKGAQATATSIFLARTGHDKARIREYVMMTFGYNLARTCDDIRPTYSFNESCQRTVPEAIVAFLDSTDYENAIRLAVSLGGDADTLACITGGIAEAFYGGVPQPIADRALECLDGPLREITLEFRAKYCSP
jgi:ADP-ribosylglycohydrolase